MHLPKRLRMDRAAYITIGTRPMANASGPASVVGLDMADVWVNSNLSDTGQHRALFEALLVVVIARLRMAGFIKGAIGMKHLGAIASGVFGILAFNGLYWPVSHAAAARFCQFGPEPPRHLQWSTLAEYAEVEARREQPGGSRRRDRSKGSGSRRPRLRLVATAPRANRRAASR